MFFGHDCAAGLLQKSEDCGNVFRAIIKIYVCCGVFVFVCVRAHVRASWGGCYLVVKFLEG